jgi:hypothetical protein
VESQIIQAELTTPSQRLKPYYGAAPQSPRPPKAGELPELYEKEHREVLRLRNEMSVLRRKNQEMKEARIAAVNARVLTAVNKASGLTT